jgi:hypothetical protein
VLTGVAVRAIACAPPGNEPYDYRLTDGGSLLIFRR